MRLSDILPDNVSVTTDKLVAGGNVVYEAIQTLRLQFRRAAYEAVRPRMDAVRKRYDVLTWTPQEQVVEGMARLPTIHLTGTNSFTLKVMRCIQGGVTGGTEPVWATTDYWINSALSDTTDGTAIWRAYNIYFFDSVNGNDTTGDGSQAAPYASTLKATMYSNTAPYATQRSGRALAFKRGGVYTNNGGDSSNVAVLLMGRATSDNATVPERVNVLAYGNGPMPVFDSTGVNHGIYINAVSPNTVRGYTTVSGIDCTGNCPTVNSTGIRAAAATTGTDETNYPMSVKILDCKVRDLTCTAGNETTVSDTDGIWLTGANNAVVGCQVYNIWDDGIWSRGANCEYIGNRVIACGASTAVWPNRTRGDCMQINSTPIGSNDIPINGLYLAGNIIDHRAHSQKQTLIINPEVSGTGRISKDYVIEWNDILGYVGPDGATNLPFYASFFQGDVRNNMIDGGHSNANVGQGLMMLMGPARVYNNFFISRGGMAGIQYGPTAGTVSGKTFSSDASGAETFYNTFVSTSGLGYGVTAAANAGTTKTHSNLFIGWSVGMNTRAGATYFNNCYKGVATPHAALAISGSTDLGGETVVDAAWVTDYRPVGSNNPIIGAGSSNTSVANLIDLLGTGRDCYNVTAGCLEGGY